MVEIEYDRKFKKNFRKRIAPSRNLRNRFEQRLKLFIKNPSHPLLKDHRLKDKMKEFRAFWITGNIGIVYKEFNETVLLYDVGTHNQVYGR